MQRFGRSDEGLEVHAFRLGSEKGLQAEILTLGGILKSLTLPVKGRRIPLVLSLPDIRAYERDTLYIGQIVGRYCNRIAYFTQAGPAFHRKAGQCFTHAGPGLA